MGLPQASLLPITTKSNETYGINSVMPEIQSLYQAGSAAILANVGMLVVPVMTANTFNSLPNGSPMIPVNLFSHSDQTTQWQSAAPNELASTGWGGRIADVLQSLNAGAQYPTVITSGGCGEFCTGSVAGDGTGGCTIAAPITAGSRTVTATYAGDSNFASSPSTPVSHTVTP